ncbi:hypothetical protein [Mesorhizobium shangrilense]|uniref:Uncharacterized protein n=1 Tax=Mesorhizobium shangrilense TaxID=460060 RepID=A0ABV2DDE1_9HYPH
MAVPFRAALLARSMIEDILLCSCWQAVIDCSARTTSTNDSGGVGDGRSEIFASSGVI